jgi:predicted O-methyltransferase YrrM
MRSPLTVSVIALAIAVPARAQRPPGPPPLHRMIRTLDRNRDGKVSAAEISKHAVEAVKQLDRNGDGRLTPDELRPPGPRPPGPPPHFRGRRRGVPGRTLPPAPRDAREKKILAVLRDMRRDQGPGMMNVPEEDGRLLRLLAESINARRVVEIGTSNGYSGVWLCLALIRTGGRLTTYEIDRGRASLARKNFRRAGVEGLVTIVLGDAHKEIAKLRAQKKTIDLLFIDADKDGYVDYLEKLLPLLRRGGLIVAHNMSMPGGGIARYLKAVGARKELETLLLHMDGAGVGVTLKKRY